MTPSNNVGTSQGPTPTQSLELSDRLSPIGRLLKAADEAKTVARITLGQVRNEPLSDEVDHLVIESVSGTWTQECRILVFRPAYDHVAQVQYSRITHVAYVWYGAYTDLTPCDHEALAVLDRIPGDNLRNSASAAAARLDN